MVHMIYAEDVLGAKIMMHRNDFWNVPPPSFVQPGHSQALYYRLQVGEHQYFKVLPLPWSFWNQREMNGSFHRGALFVARWFLGVGALAFTAHRVQACSTTESHFREPRDQLFWQHRLGSELLCPTCYMIQSPVCWSTNNLMKILDSGTFNILSYFCFFNINLFTYGAKKCSGVYALGPWDI